MGSNILTPNQLFKTRSHCKVNKGISDFYFRKAENRWGSWCKPCEATRESKNTPYTRPTKICTKCKIEKTVEEFGKERTRGNRPRAECKPCELIRSRGRVYKKPSSQQILKHNLKKKYGISLQDYEDMFDRQEGLCVICQTPPKIGQLLCVDHDHKTGKVRQLLCQRCNSTLGRIENNPGLLQKMIDYLQEHRSD
jgi:hypothetical protein